MFQFSFFGDGFSLGFLHLLHFGFPKHEISVQLIYIAIYINSLKILSAKKNHNEASDEEFKKVIK